MYQPFQAFCPQPYQTPSTQSRPPPPPQQQQQQSPYFQPGQFHQ
eukprot:CAMPEP_0185923890 /NCGR_PEP_ID=MMETSP0924C-20121207/11710_1 /TAXON_ID=321610 /ORGANISM="Perkinsus chesapeaki, Strain ATCC PRA-65" /LENGTH=43 /DNA_ID= /DNA_START= /DNA_END= /DNA_ORIENTATION=